MRNNLLEKKWRKLLWRVQLFQLVPFVDFVLASGSLATGNVNENSDFDVIVGVRQGRIFTARFFSVAIFQIFGWRRRSFSHKREARDKICLNHFVTPKGYKLSPPYNEYWQELYRNLVPVTGRKTAIQKFFESNDWLKPPRLYSEKDKRHLFERKFPLTALIELFLGGRVGDALEAKLKEFQVTRIKRGLPRSLGYKPRIAYNDNELEFHPDTKRIELIVGLKNPKKILK